MPMIIFLEQKLIEKQIDSSGGEAEEETAANQ